jgi:hypothetical protein
VSNEKIELFLRMPYLSYEELLKELDNLDEKKKRYYIFTGLRIEIPHTYLWPKPEEIENE